MAMRSKSTKQTAGEAAGSTVDADEQRVLAFAEQLGRMVGTVQAKAEGWLNREALNAQVSQVRDSAAQLLEHLGVAGRSDTKVRKSKRPAKSPASDAARTTRGAVDAPGKRHRKPAPNEAMPKGSDSRTNRVRITNPPRTRGRR